MRRKGLIIAFVLGGFVGGAAALADSDKSDSEFAHKAAAGGMAEVKLSKLAADKSASSEVKSFARKMVSDHTKANQELKKLASQKSLTLPTTMDAEHQRAYDKLVSLTGDDFDKQYMKAMTDDHDDTVKLFKDETQNGKDDELKQFAIRTLPIIEKHDNMAHHDDTMMEHR
jgi:putative membrane protein